MICCAFQSHVPESTVSMQEVLELVASPRGLQQNNLTRQGSPRIQEQV